MSFTLAAVAQLSRHLRNERLTAEHERRCIRELNAELDRLTLRLYQLSWISCQQLSNLQRLIVARVDCTPALCCRRDRQLQRAVFVAGHARLSHRHQLYSQLLTCLRSSPQLLACMMQLPMSADSCERLVDVVFASVFGSCLTVDDHQQLLRLLQLLIVQQVATAESPQLLLRRGACAFSRLYRAFVEALLAARLFLSVSLREPLERLVAGGDQWVSQPSSSCPELLLQQPASAEGRLSPLVEEFVQHIAVSMHCFPSSVAWLIVQLHGALTAQSECVERCAQARAVVVDLVFGMFICTAIVDPQQHGVIRLPVNPVTGQTLIQVGQMLQSVALASWPGQCTGNDPLPDCRPLMSHVLSSVLRLGAERLTNDSATAGTSCLQRPAVMISAQQLQLLVHQLRAAVTAEEAGAGLPEACRNMALTAELSQNGLGPPEHTEIAPQMPHHTPESLRATEKQTLFDAVNDDRRDDIETAELQRLDGDKTDMAGGSSEDSLSGKLQEQLGRQLVRELLSQLPIDQDTADSSDQPADQEPGGQTDTTGHDGKRRKRLFARVPTRVRRRGAASGDAGSAAVRDQETQGEVEASLEVLMLPLQADPSEHAVGLLSEDQVVSAASSGNFSTSSHDSRGPAPDLSLPLPAGDSDLPQIGREPGPNLAVLVPDTGACSSWSTDVLAGSDCESVASAPARSNSVDCLERGKAAVTVTTTTTTSRTSSESDTASTSSFRQIQAFSSTAALSSTQSVGAAEYHGQSAQDTAPTEQATGLLACNSVDARPVADKPLAAQCVRGTPVARVPGDKRCSDTSTGSHHSRSPRNLLRSLGRRLGGSRRQSRDSESANSVGGGSEETMDDILDRYRAAGLREQQSGDVHSPAGDEEAVQLATTSTTYCRLADAKHKLRRALSSPCVQSAGWRGVDAPGQCPLLAWLEVCQSEALLLAHRAFDADQQDGQDEDEPDASAQLHETIRCVSALSAGERRSVLQQLRSDLAARRRCYSDYLAASRRRLLSDCARVRQLLAHAQRDGSRACAALINRCVLMFLERHKQDVAEFQTNFSALPVSDEKTHQLSVYLRQLQQRLQNDPNWCTRDASQLHLVDQAMERALLTQLYSAAVFPNGEADHCRDQLFSAHLRRLAAAVTPTHRLLAIPPAYHAEAPWPSAQAEISALPAFATAADKLACVSRCCAAIVHLLQLGGGGSAAADELTPVLVYVLIQAQPPALLSTVQYVDNFHGQRLAGQQHYWWVQFCSAVEFIKTMDC